MHSIAAQIKFEFEALRAQAVQPGPFEMLRRRIGNDAFREWIMDAQSRPGDLADQAKQELADLNEIARAIELDELVVDAVSSSHPQ